MAATIDIKALQELRAQSAHMISYYSRSEEKAQQNAALKAAGLSPLHSESQLNWDAQQAAAHKRYVEVLDAVIAHHGGAIEQAAA